MLGKTGKILEFIAGLSILIDIWGPAKILAFGHALRFWDAESSLNRTIDRYYRYLLIPWLGWSAYAAGALIVRNPRPGDIGAVSPLAGDLGAYLFHAILPDGGLVLASIVVGLLSGIALVFALLLWLGMALAICEVSARHVAVWLEEPDAANRLRVVALVFLLTGFPLDFFFGS